MVYDQQVQKKGHRYSSSSSGRGVLECVLAGCVEVHFKRIVSVLGAAAVFRLEQQAGQEIVVSCRVIVLGPFTAASRVPKS